ncbi:MAG: arsenate reductase ArsC, partial [Alphaproteobacteria bacterium]
AGSMPRGQVNPHALPLVRELGFEVADFRSKSWDEFAAPGAPRSDFVITVCDNAAGEVFPIWPGGPITAHWGIPDPAEATGSDEEIAVAFRQAARRLSDRIELLLALPLDALDHVSLQRELSAIGTLADTATA